MDILNFEDIRVCLYISLHLLLIVVLDLLWPWQELLVDLVLDLLYFDLRLMVFVVREECLLLLRQFLLVDWCLFLMLHLQGISLPDYQKSHLLLFYHQVYHLLAYILRMSKFFHHLLLLLLGCKHLVL